MAIIVDSKTPTQDASEASDVHQMDVPPPEYVAEEPPRRTNELTVSDVPPVNKSSTDPPTNHDRWWRRWLRSPIALALTFLGCAVIATGIGLAVHFTVGKRNQPPPWPEGGPGPYGPNGNDSMGADAFGPWSSSMKTFAFPRDTAHMEFLSLEGVVDGYTQINVGRPDQTDIEADVSIQWKARMLTSTPIVNSYYDPTNSSISITCPPSYYNDSASLANVFIYANITVRLPHNYTYGSLALRSTAQSPHCWITTIANMTDGKIAFDKVLLESGQGALIVQNMTTDHLEAFSDYGDIYGTVRAIETYNVTSRHGVVSLVNLANATAITTDWARSPAPGPGPGPGPRDGDRGRGPGPAPIFRC